MKILLGASCLLGAASSFSAITAPPPPAARGGASSVLAGLRNAPLVRASDPSSPVLLTNEWRSGMPFGIGDEVAVLAFLRHYG